MSSHHIVREDQEPALIIEDINGITEHQLGQLLEWSPTIITHSGSFESVIKRGIKVDILFANKLIALPQDHILTLPLSDTFLDAALAYLVKKDYRAANIVSNQGDTELLFKYANEINTTLLGNGMRIFVVKSRFSKWRPKGEVIRLYGNNISTIGLMQQGPNHYLTEADGIYSIRFAGKYGLVGEYL
ncbi:thiamine diphosphokinase [Parapedobacter tibetensis]|uniref:thiamine diphosphokinase n=1 Tax=Parapedobacter tibetensis TaxID=2972951 RepID=UPI00214DDB80|nr:thiamine diphosphokinase [Parapedobacter tibetensis]